MVPSEFIQRLRNGFGWNPISHFWYLQYSEYQELLYSIIKQKHKSGMGYRKIAQWLNENAYKTMRGHEFKNTHAFSFFGKEEIA